MSTNNTKNSDSDEEDSLTNSYDIRWEWLSSIVSMITALSLPTLIIGHIFWNMNLGSIPSEWYFLYTIGYSASIKYSLGRGEFSALRKMLN